MTNTWMLLVLLAAAAPAVRPPEAAPTLPPAPASSEGADPYLWLEEVEGPKALDWVRERNARSLGRLEKDPRYAAAEKAIREIVLAKDRIPQPALRGGWVYNFWQDEIHVRGLWRRTALAEYRKDSPAWQAILDLDDLARREEENWVWKGAECLPPSGERCLLTLSRGGKDAAVVREFDVARRSFVEDGFRLPEAKSSTSWIDADTIFVATDFGPGSLTTSGYPRLVKVWKRGTPLEKAELVFEGQATDVGADAYTMFRPEGNVSIVERSPSFFEEEVHLYAGGRLRPIPFPRDADLRAAFEGRLFAELRTDWKPRDRTFPRGAVVALPIDSLDVARVEVVFEPSATTSFQDLSTTRGALYATLLEDVKGRIVQLKRDPAGRWTAIPQPYPDHGAVDVISAEDDREELLVGYTSFLVPASIFLSTGGGAAPEVLKRAPERFSAAGLMVEQLFATSRDGTKIPYSIVRSANLARDGRAPVLLSGYGGFMASSTPAYLSTVGKYWLEKGGVYVQANIRGGAEYGPAWHQAVLKENRPRVFDDFIAVAEDLVARKITSPSRLAISGGSNGGLLVGACFTRRPELFGAVVCVVPLLDMMRYTKLPPGASWIGEYGDPEDPALREVIRSYSPYQNLARGKKYPEVLFVTSTRDDRVHPGHARKMAARMEEMGHPFLYYENIEGGHGAAANLEQYIHRVSLQAVYLYQKVMD